MRQIKVKERVKHRYLGALRIIDQITGSPVKRLFSVTSPGMTFFVNRSWLHVIRSATGLESHADAFEYPPGPSVDPYVPDLEALSFTVTVRDPLGEYLDRSFNLDLPRNPDPEADRNIFIPIDVPLFASPAAHLSHNWSVVRVSLYDLSDVAARIPVAGAMLRVTDTDGELVMSGVSDLRGEAAVIIPGIPITTFSQGAAPSDDLDDDLDEDENWMARGPVVETQTPVQLEITVNPDAEWPVNPTELENKHAEWRRPFRVQGSDASIDQLALELKTGMTQAITLYIDLP